MSSDLLIPVPSPLQRTADGSLTLYHNEAQQAYHNQAGAWSESYAHYIKYSQFSALLTTQQAFTLLDPSFGLGYNCFSLVQAVWEWLHQPDTPSFSTPLRLNIIAFELDASLAPLWPMMLNQPCYTNLPPQFKCSFEHNIYYQTQNTEAKPLFLNTPKDRLELDFSLFVGDANQQLAACLKKGVLKKESVDVVFYDMFSPQVVPQLWCSDVFRAYHAVLHPIHGQLLTYSCARVVKDALSEAGFTYSVTKQKLGRKRGGLIAKV